jgi:hypothetical protein
MPYPNEHAARQMDPEMFEKMRRGPIPGAPAGIEAIFGIREDGTSAIQSVRADSSEFTAEQFREWLNENELKADIEEAIGEDMKDDDYGRIDEDFGEKDYTYGEVYSGVSYLLADGAVGWVEIVRSGRFFGNTGPVPRRVELSEEDILAMASTYEQVLSEGWFNGGAPVGYNHAQAMGDRTPEATRAAARVQQVEVRPNDHGGLSLWGLFAWTDEGARRVGAQEFSSISAELIPPSAATSKLNGKKLGGYTLVGATLTNTPMIPGMQAPSLSDRLAASDNPRRIMLSEETAPDTTETPKMSDLIVKLAEATGLPAEAPELLAEVRRLQAEASKVEALTETLETATKEIEQLRTRKEQLEASEQTRLLDDACASGRIAPTEREDYWQIVTTLGEEKAHRLFAEGRVAPVGKRISSEVEVVETTQQSLDSAVQNLAERLVSEEGLNEAAAYSRAMVEVLTDPSKLALYESETLN